MDLGQFIKTLHERKNDSGRKSESEVSLSGEERALFENGTDTTKYPLSKDTRAAPNASEREALGQFKQRIHTLLVGKLDAEEMKALSEERQRIELRARA
jgi:hypothetical protein